MHRRFVIGTAGHVDHGKSTLVRALTGIDPDRLAEERQREMTIDLGFAWFTLPSGREVSVIDVPGHERFVGNMLAGIGGIDIALLVIAADDGPMPQTREHLAILDLLEVRHGVVALSRSDLVDEEWQALVMEEVRELLVPTSLANSPIVPISGITGSGIDTLVSAVDQVLDAAQSRDTNGRPRLPVDRSFRITGFGTVVTGTLIDGALHVGQELTVYPQNRTVRVRGLQEHRHQVEQADAGSRVAVNLSGADADEIRRGDVMAPGGSLTPSVRLDCRIRLLPDAPAPMKQNDDVIVFTGASELPAKVTLLDRDTVPPGEEGWIQLRLSAPTVTLRGDRVILRRPSPATTIGGGVIVDPSPPRHKRHQQAVIRSLEVLAEGTPEDLILQELDEDVVEAGALARQTGMPDILPLLQAMVDAGEIVAVREPDVQGITAKTMIVRRAVFDRITTALMTMLDEHHRSRPLSSGIRRDDLRARLNIRSQKPFDAVLREIQSRGHARSDGAVVAATGFEIRLTEDQRAAADAFLAAARLESFAPPPPEDWGLSAELVSALATRGELERVTAQIVYPMDVFQTIRRRVLEMLEAHGEITLAGYRDMFGTSRKFAQPTLEHLDEMRVTRRKGDVRVKYVGAGAASV